MMTDKTLNNMVITDVTECSDHAKGRIGRVIESVNLMDDGTAFVMYPAGIQGAQPYFKLHDVTVKKKRPFSKKIILRSQAGTYTMRPASNKEMEVARLSERTHTAFVMVKQAFGDDACYMAPEQLIATAESLMRKC